MRTEMSTNWIVETIEQLERAVGVFPRVEKFTASNGEPYDVLRISLFSGSATAINLTALRKNMPKDTLLYYGNVIYPNSHADLTGANADIRFDLTAINSDDPSIILEFEGTEARARGWDGKRLASELHDLESNHQLSFDIFHAAKLSFSAEVSFIPGSKPKEPAIESPHLYSPTASSVRPLKHFQDENSRSQSELPPESLVDEGASDDESQKYAFNQNAHEHDDCDDDICTSSLSPEQEAQSEESARKLLEFCPELFWGKGIRMDVQTLARNIRGFSVVLNFVWPDRTGEAGVGDHSESVEPNDDFALYTEDKVITRIHKKPL